jgi:hypothetical protein
MITARRTVAACRTITARTLVPGVVASPPRPVGALAGTATAVTSAPWPVAVLAAGTSTAVTSAPRPVAAREGAATALVPGLLTRSPWPVAAAEGVATALVPGLLTRPPWPVAALSSALASANGIPAVTTLRRPARAIALLPPGAPVTASFARV